MPRTNTHDIPVHSAYVVEIPVDDLSPDPANPRRDLGPTDDLDALAESILAHGILEPLLVTTRTDGGYTILAGHRRHAGAQRAAVATVPCIVRDDLAAIDTSERLQLQLLENLARRDLTPIDEARALASLVEAGMSQRDIAGVVGRNQSHISKRLKLLTLPDQVLDRVDAGHLPLDIAGDLARLVDHPDRLDQVLAHLGDDTPNPFQIEDARYELETQLEQARRDQAIAAARAELDAAGITEVDWPQFGSWQRTKVRPIGEPHTYLWPGKAPTKAKLTKAGHLAAAINPANGTIVWVCTDPAVYDPAPATGPDNDERGVDPVDAERKAIAAARKDQARRRMVPLTSWIRDLGSGNCTSLVRDSLATAGCDAMFLDQVAATFRAAIPTNIYAAPAKQRLVELFLDTTCPDDTPLGGWLAAHPDPLLAAIAWRAAGIEADLAAGHGSYSDPDVLEAHYRTLVELGYRPDPDEIERLGWPTVDTRSA
ncbi:MAG: ParB/RepB/Spo0J family partition protein [Acidimicrobiales bacterium]